MMHVFGLPYKRTACYRISQGVPYGRIIRHRYPNTAKYRASLSFDIDSHLINTTLQLV